MQSVYVKVFTLIELDVGQPQDVRSQLSLRPQALHHGIAVSRPHVGAESIVGDVEQVPAEIVLVRWNWLHHKNCAHTVAGGYRFNHFLIGQPSVDYALQGRTISKIVVSRVLLLRPPFFQPPCGLNHGHRIESTPTRFSGHETPEPTRKRRFAFNESEIVEAVDKYSHLGNETRPK